jgi:hypothetical protein
MTNDSRLRQRPLETDAAASTRAADETDIAGSCATERPLRPVTANAIVFSSPYGQPDAGTAQDRAY